MDELIFRDALLEKMGERVRKYENVDECTELTILEDMHIIKNAPAVDAVLRSVVEQIKWERDCAMQQLKDHDIPFGGIAPDVVKVVRCKDCKHFYDTHINPAHSCKRGGAQVWDVSFTPDDFCSYGERREDDER